MVSLTSPNPECSLASSSIWGGMGPQEPLNGVCTPVWGRYCGVMGAAPFWGAGTPTPLCSREDTCALEPPCLTHKALPCPGSACPAYVQDCCENATIVDRGPCGLSGAVPWVLLFLTSWSYRKTGPPPTLRLPRGSCSCPGCAPQVCPGGALMGGLLWTEAELRMKLH